MGIFHSKTIHQWGYPAIPIELPLPQSAVPGLSAKTPGNAWEPRLDESVDVLRSRCDLLIYFENMT